MLASLAQAKIVTKDIVYKDGDIILQGYIAYDDAIKKKRPAVIIVHEWWGHNKFARERAEVLAKRGYVGFALDMYGKGKLAKHPDNAKKFSSQFQNNSKLIHSRFNAAYSLIAKHEKVDAKKIAAIGYCFGGSIVLEMARRGKALTLVASFHGSLATKNPAKKGQVKAQIFVAHGKADPFIPMAQVEALKKETKAAGAKLTVNVYEKAKHSFTIPGADKLAKKFKMPLAYNKEADEDSWSSLLKLLGNAFE